MTLAEADPLLVLDTLYAAAYVTVVVVGQGFLASVLRTPGQTAVARLDHSLRGHPDEGRVLREVMLATTGIKDDGFFYWDERLTSLPYLVSR